MPAIADGQSAEGIVDEKSVGKIPTCVGTVEGRNGGRTRLGRRVHEYEMRERL